LDTAGENAIPRDNVVLEAGFFMSAKGKFRVLMVREKGSKIPADLGGDIYASLEDKSDINLLQATWATKVEETSTPRWRTSRI
jgi:predicted nucleotide-binding protein